MTLEELRNKETDLLNQLAEVQCLIAQDKIVVKEALYQIKDEALKDRLADKIKRIRDFQGFIDLRKSEMSCWAFNFETPDAKCYQIIKGSNWCNSVLEMGEIPDYNSDTISWNLTDLEAKWHGLRNTTDLDGTIAKLLDEGEFLPMIVALACLEY